MTLFWQYFRANLKGLLLWIFFVCLFVLAIANNGPAMVQSGTMGDALERLPEALIKMVGDTRGLDPLDGFIVMELGTWNAMLFSLYGALLALGVITREIDRRTIDFLLAMPVDRRQVILSRLAVVALNTGLLALSTWLTLFGVLSASGHQASFGGFALMVFNQWLLAMALSGLCLLSSVWIDDYSFGVKVWLGATSTGMFLEWALRAGGLSRWARFWSPFSYVDAPELLRSGLPAGEITLLAVVAVLGFALSIPAFERKQIAV